MRTLFELSGVMMLTMVCLAFAQTAPRWKNHDMRRPERPIITPTVVSTQEKVGKAPSDAVVLFDGTDLSNWVDGQGKPSKWIVKNDFMECVKGSGYIYSKQGFGSCQLHVEFCTPTPAIGASQGRGNSGVFLMNLYEVQVLDSYQNKTYSDGQCSAIYGQYPPMVNASLAPGQWQSYDIIFHRPLFDDRGNLQRKADITVIHNGVLVQDHVELLGPTNWMVRQPYAPHADKLPLAFQDHGNPVRYRNIWIRELPDDGGLPGDAYTLPPDKVVQIKPELLDRYVGKYEFSPGNVNTITREGHVLYLSMYEGQKVEIRPESESRFNAVIIAVTAEFNINAAGQVESMTLYHSGEQHKANRMR